VSARAARFGDMTVEENLRLGAHLLAESEFEAQLAWLFDLFPILQERRRQAARTLSGGPAAFIDQVGDRYL
jgi:ABC-type branched-subunit amino acid transport system ATPase component